MVLLGFAWSAAVVLALLVPDYRVLVAVAYTPVVLLGASFGWPPGVHLSEAFPWPVVNQFVCIGGGLIWAAAAATGCVGVEHKRRNLLSTSPRSPVFPRAACMDSADIVA